MDMNISKLLEDLEKHLDIHFQKTRDGMLRDLENAQGGLLADVRAFLEQKLVKKRTPRENLKHRRQRLNTRAVKLGGTIRKMRGGDIVAEFPDQEILEKLPESDESLDKIENIINNLVSKGGWLVKREGE